MDEWQARTARVVEIAKEAGAQALGYFRDAAALRIEVKGKQDFVSQADREVELTTRRLLAEAFPHDGIVGEEHAPEPGSSGITWVIDPIDGTSNFINSIPCWVVAIAGVENGKLRAGVIHDPCHDETFTAVAGQGAFLNGAPIRVAEGRSLSEGTVSLGYSTRVPAAELVTFLDELMAEGGIYNRNGSGAISLAYVAAGRFLGYAEQHMNAWDCLAGQLMVAEAGGRIEDQDIEAMIRDGGRVIAGNSEVFARLVEMADRHFT